MNLLAGHILNKVFRAAVIPGLVLGNFSGSKDLKELYDVLKMVQRITITYLLLFAQSH
jgi:hypothetical protein